MSRKLQIVFDCTNPEKLASFYAEALYCKLQDPPAGFDSWEGALEAWGVPKEDWSSASAILDPEGVGPRIFFQRMDTKKTGKNRVHLDVNASEGMKVSLNERKEQVNSEARRLQRLGATESRVWEENGEYWIVLYDPEGNEFCVQ
jgi:Glyoxalase-like domain